MKAAVVTLAEQAGGEEAGEYTDPHVLDLRRLLASQCKGPYAKDVEEFALVLRTDGDVQQFGFEGCQRLRRSFKDRYITVDVGIPKRRWKGVAPKAFRSWLADAVKEGMLCCFHRLERDGVPVDREKFLEDYDLVRARFLNRFN